MSKEERESAAGMAGADANGSARRVALIIGVTGLVGRELARALVADGPKWRLVYGVARSPHGEDDGVGESVNGSSYQFVACDLLNKEEARERLSPLSGHVTHVFWVTWASEFPAGTRACCDQNKTMLSNALDALRLSPPLPPNSGDGDGDGGLVTPSTPMLRHLCLQTGVKHYVSLEKPVDDDGPSEFRYDEDFPRVKAEGDNGDGCNFYYALEDLLMERLAGTGVGWSVHRPGLLLGASRRTLYNFVGSLCVYASVCRRLGLPFLFGGHRQCWEESYLDISDARLVAEQLIWAASSRSSTAAFGEAYNAVNGPTFTWKEVWPALVAKFDVQVGLAREDGEEMFSPGLRYSALMADKGGVWEDILREAGLRRTRMDELANWEFLDNVFRCPVRMLASRRKVEGLGFTTTYETLDSIFYWVDRMREDGLVP